MRLWSIHPKYLDQKGLTALWREGLLALKVLKGETKGYKTHPQLDRFKKLENPLLSIIKYLEYIHNESIDRHYNFNKSKLYGIIPNFYNKKIDLIKVSSAQVLYEFERLQSKLKIRDINKCLENISNTRFSNQDFVSFEDGPAIKYYGQMDDIHSSYDIVFTHPLFEVYKSDKLEKWEKVK